MTSSAPRGSLTVLAIDPGSEQSAYVLWEEGVLTAHGKEPNRRMLELIATHWPYVPVVFEQITSYGMPVGAEVFETVFWTGRMFEAVRQHGQYRGAYRMFRRDVKLHLCGQARAKDANIRQALIDGFGGKLSAIGKKASPGPLYGLKADEWQALALAVTWHDLHASAGAETPKQVADGSALTLIEQAIKGNSRDEGQNHQMVAPEVSRVAGRSLAVSARPYRHTGTRPRPTDVSVHERGDEGVTVDARDSH